MQLIFSSLSLVYKGSRLLFNIIIYLQAYKRLPEFSGYRGRVYPGHSKPRYPIPEPRIESAKFLVSLEWNQHGFRKAKNSNHIMPPQIIIVEPVSNLE